MRHEAPPGLLTAQAKGGIDGELMQKLLLVSGVPVHEGTSIFLQ